jgi:ATP/maltotriose-dependent transcriptional regulator MalT
MPRPRKLVSARKAAKPRTTLRPAAIDRARADAMAAIARQRGAGDEADALLDTAHRLLTRHWAKADWAARATLIETAGWLIHVAAGANGDAPTRKAAAR